MQPLCWLCNIDCIPVCPCILEQMTPLQLLTVTVRTVSGRAQELELWPNYMSFFLCPLFCVWVNNAPAHTIKWHCWDMGANRLLLFCKTTETETFSRMFGKDRVHRSGVAFKEIFAKKSLSIGVDDLKMWYVKLCTFLGEYFQLTAQSCKCAFDGDVGLHAVHFWTAYAANCRWCLIRHTPVAQ